MQTPIVQELSDFLLEVTPLMEQVDDLSLETAAELYDMLDFASKSATTNIDKIGPELRVTICDWQDKILERIITILPPFEKLTEPVGVYTPAIQGYRKWNNVELMKDKGLAGYLLAREIGAHPVMFFGTKLSDYSYSPLLPGLEILCNDSEINVKDAYYEHLRENYAKMDILILHGMYIETIDYLNEYRKLRPDGKVFCGLDMSCYWMVKHNWDSPPAKQFAAQCDIIATSCTFVRDALNRHPKVQFSCRFLPNAFFDPTGTPIIADPEQKENIILTVGRIGTEQKNNEEMLVAFANSKISNKWTLRLVGTVEPAFQAYIDEYFTLRPDLKSRVIFTGPITDKAELYAEYAKAKIFVLTSQLEGGTPNVYAEALVHGCMFITSGIDAADDMTDNGRLGVKYKLGDVNALTSVFNDLCPKASRRAFQTHIPKALDYANRKYDWNCNVKKLAFMLFK
ncbi:MAG: glycosyltransferase family 4 protein [Oscillospiraceae bacterium]|nr:glycosyltransferase family 4 protein [Oscillospiraceae bacterium]